MNTKEVNIRVLAFLGDAIFSLYVREKLIESGINNAKILQDKSIKYVSAKGQVEILNNLINNSILTEEELDIVRRGRNYKNDSHLKNTDIVTHKTSTGFEALLGDLYLNDKDRLYEILNMIEVK